MTTPEKPAAGGNDIIDYSSEIRSILDRLDELDRETAGYLKILAEHASLSRVEAMLTVEIARHCGQIADCGCSYEASRKFRRNLDQTSGSRMRRFLDSVAEADGQVVRSETAQIRQFATELGLPT